MESGLVEALFEAITVGDEGQVELCLKSATIAIALEFETIYGESPLHLCVKLGGVSHLGVVRRLLASGLVDFDQRDNEGQTVLEYAYQSGDQELTKQLIGVEMEGLDDVTACYKMLKHDSLDLFKLFLSMKNMSEEETFKNIASAFVKLNVKNFVLSNELQYFAQWKLSDYSYQNLSGNWPGVKDPKEWKNYIDIIDDCWRVISVKYDTRLYDDIDDQLLHRSHVIHNCLYFVKHKQFLNHLPMQEIVFCIAMFVSVCTQKSTQPNEYCLLVNKRLVMDFMRMVNRQLKLTKNHLEMVEKELTTIMQKVLSLDADAKHRLIEEMLEKLKATNFPNKDHWIAKTTKKLNDVDGPNKDVLIKDMMKKIKSSDKMYFTNEMKNMDETNKQGFIDAISKGDLHVTHPQNVANRLMAGWKKGQSIDETVSEIVSEECFDLKHHLRGKDRCIIQQAKKCYRKTKQLYSLQKVLMYWDLVIPQGTKDDVTTDAMFQRMMQVLGETLKNTQNSPNMPGMVEQTLQFFLSVPFLKSVKYLREVFSHGFSLKKVLQKNDMYKAFRIFPDDDFYPVSVFFHLLRIVTLQVAMETMYGSMRQCSSYEELRSFLLYVGDISKIVKLQKTAYKNVRKYFKSLNDNFKQLEGDNVTRTEAFADQFRHFEVKRAIVNRVGNYLESSQCPSFVNIRKACFAGDDFSAMRRTLDWKLIKGWANKFWTDVRESWIPIQTGTTMLELENERLAGLHPFKMTSFFTCFELTMDSVERIDYILHTREVIKDLCIAKSLDENAVQELNQRLKPYYDNIFLVQSKWGIVKNFCTKKKIVLNEGLVNELTNKDQVKLQQLFDDHREKLRFIFEQNRINTVESLVKHLYRIHPSTVSAMEHLQLELNEMLMSVGYFGDSFQYMKYRLPVIQGKNYRNFLAHDSLSYNILTDSLLEKIVINAYVLGYTELKLFANRVTKSEDITRALPTVKETHEWVNEQHHLLDAFRTKNVDAIVDAIKNGGEIQSQFCCSLSKRFCPPRFVKLTELVDFCNTEQTVVEFLNKYSKKHFSDQRKQPDNQIVTAILAGNYQTVFDLTIRRGDTEIREQLYIWPELIPSLRETDFFNSEAFIRKKAVILSKLIEYGNERGVREMLPYLDVIQDVGERDSLADAVMYCVKSIADILFHLTPKPDLKVGILTIFIHWHDLFFNMIVNVKMDSHTYHTLLTVAAQARNYTVAAWLLEHDTFKQFIPEIFEDVCLKAGVMGDTAMLQHLLNIYPACRQLLGKITYYAAERQRWKCVSLLIDRDAPVDILYPGKRHKENTLFILVKFGLWRLIDRVRSVDCQNCVDVRVHPLAVAIEYGNASWSMIRTLERLGFDWFDNSIILHWAIEQRYDTGLATIWEKIDAVSSDHLNIEDSHFALAIKILLRWEMIGFVEESTTEKTTLTCAINNNDKEMVKKLLDRAKSMRQLEGIGILNNIVFKTSTSIICFGEQSKTAKCTKVQNSCKDMITRLKNSAVLDLGWQEFTIDLGVPVEFYVLSANKEKIELSQPTTDVNMRKSGSLLNSLNHFMTVSNALFTEASIIAARFKTSEGSSVCFWQVEDINCVYNVLPLGAEIDLSSTVNYRNLTGETPLHTCMEVPEELAMVEMLVEAGADPLLTIKNGMTVLHRFAWSTKNYQALNYLLDVCQKRELRDDQGVSFLELEDNIAKNRLIHIAVLTGRRDLVDRLIKSKVDISVKNSFGITPAQLALNNFSPNREHMLKLLLNHDSSSIDTVDDKGRSLLHYAVKDHSIEVLKEILEHDPDITKICHEGHTPLYAAIWFKKIRLANYLLQHAIKKHIRGITSKDEVDLVSLSLKCNDFSLSKSLLEYELEHPLEESSVADLNRIEALLNSTVPEENSNVWEFVQSRELPESENFLIHLKRLCVSLRDQ